MTIWKFVVAGSMFLLGGCQTSATYTQYMDGPPLEYAQAKCNVMAPATNQGYVAFGSVGFVAGAAIGNAIGNAIREEEFKRNCMAMQGWRQDPPGSRKSAASPAPTIKAAHQQPHGAPTGLVRGKQIGIPSKVIAGQ